MTIIVLPFVPAAPRTGFSRMMAFAKSAWMRHETKRALSKLDDHLLRDIGITPPPRDPADALLRHAGAPW